ncbi:uncharacterized protein BDV14DRAFT_178758 [Aspergillus stella-maris]|uniref:uncharacterized protein n=1 Tax=Aspergillus stella-maris TaxID=1810926 RepID=UPI003CCD17BE
MGTCQIIPDCPGDQEPCCFIPGCADCCEGYQCEPTRLDPDRGRCQECIVDQDICCTDGYCPPCCEGLNCEPFEDDPTLGVCQSSS